MLQRQNAFERGARLWCEAAGRDQLFGRSLKILILKILVQQRVQLFIVHLKHDSGPRQAKIVAHANPHQHFRQRVYLDRFGRAVEPDLRRLITQGTQAKAVFRQFHAVACRRNNGVSLIAG